MYTLYIAFSIHGTECFISATKSFTSKDARDQWLRASRDHHVVDSRIPGADKSAGLKVQWSALNRKDGKPTVSPSLVLSRFRWLEADGWVINALSRKRFVERHYARKTRPVSR